MVDFNLQGLRTRTFKGFVQFQIPDGSAYYRMKERQSLAVTFNFLREPHYSDSGAKALDPAGHNHTFNLRVKFTSDLADDTYSASSDKQTLSYWIYKNSVNEPINVVFVTTLEALAGPGSGSDANDKFIHMKFTLDPTLFGPVTFGQGGSNEISIQGEIISIDYIKRHHEATPP